MQRRSVQGAKWVAGRCLVLSILMSATPQAVSDEWKALDYLDRLPLHQGICVVVGASQPGLAVELAQPNELLIYVQSEDADRVAAVRTAAAEARLLGTRVWAEQGSNRHLHLADNLADAAIVDPRVWRQDESVRREVMRVVHPGGQVLAGSQTVAVPIPDGVDDWSHPYHGPDNNPQSTDALARAPYLTQFLCEPWYVPMPQVTVASGGRVFKAFGHIALKRREWRWVNRLVAINGFNGTLLWERPLKPGFMMHRNTLIATSDAVYLADDSSCKVLDAEDGERLREIVIPETVDADGVWKWMALQDGVLYALVGATEPIDTVIRGTRQPAGWPWNGLGSGYEGEYAWGFGRTLLAMNERTEQILWTYRSSEPIDSRALCMADGKIFVYSHQKFLACVNAGTGKELWRTSDARLMEAIGEHDRAQTPSKGFSTSAYAKANSVGVYFAGPQRHRIVAISARDGALMWDYPDGNFQLVLREDALYAMGRTQTSKKFDYRTGEILADL
ncbi:MAG: PQQ-binding-like beta-propeller repeat protein [Pirellulaceae bacterium]